MGHFFADNAPYAVYIPRIPKRRGLRKCAKWLGSYLGRVVRPERYEAIHVLAYISGGFVLRQLAAGRPIQHLQHVIYVRSPIQERTLAKVRQRYGSLLLWAISGQLALDVVALDVKGLGFPIAASGQGLIVETGVSKLARSIGVAADQIPKADWDAPALLPNADDMIRVPESHDDVYTSESLLGQTLHFFSCHRFAKTALDLTAGAP
jgi:hypothetical protein